MIECDFNTARVRAEKEKKRKEKDMKTAEELYQENLRRQAEDLVRSWGRVQQSDGTWSKSISQDAVIKRINRKLEAENPGFFMRLKRTRGARLALNLGDLYLINGRHNMIVEHHLDLEEVAKRYDALSQDEHIAQV